MNKDNKEVDFQNRSQKDLEMHYHKKYSKNYQKSIERAANNMMIKYINLTRSYPLYNEV